MAKGTWNSAPARHLAAALAASTMLIGVAAIAPASAQSDTIVIARDMDIDSLDPARAFCDTCQIYLTSAYDRLVDLDKDKEAIERFGKQLDGMVANDLILQLIAALRAKYGVSVDEAVFANAFRPQNQQ